MAAAVPDTLLERLAAWAVRQPTKTAFTYHDDEGKPISSVTYAELDRQTAALAHAFMRHKAGLSAGDRVLLVFLPSLDFIVSFLACLRAGLIAVPVYPPDPRKVRAYISAFSQTAKSCGARVAITHGLYLNSVSLAGLKDTAMKILSFGMSKSSTGSVTDAWPDISWIDSTAMLKDATAASSSTHALDAATRESLAFLQYTSGSTSEPKGVMISHGNLAHNLYTIVRSLHASEATIVASWLPQYHDMGLIGSYLGIVYCGGSGAYASPLSFIKRPSLWIQLINHYRATHIQSPNFGYALVARKWRAAPLSGTFDLSCVQHMFNAAEPISPAAMQDFVATFAPLGLRGDAMKPGYGLAEHCVYVSDGGQRVLQLNRKAFENNQVIITASRTLEELWSSKLPESSTAETVDVVSCGPVAPFTEKNADVEVAVVNSETLANISADAIGEVCISSPSVAQGYWGREQQSNATFRVLLPGKDASKAFLRTGDLGFIHEGELYICGRSKDLIIVRGKNLFPQDVESIAESHPQIRPGATAAFQAPQSASSVDHAANDVLVLVAEVRDPTMSAVDLERLSADIRTGIVHQIGLSPSVMLLLRPHTARKTTSGKIARSWNKKAYVAMQGDPSTGWAGSNDAILHFWRSAGMEDEVVSDVLPTNTSSNGQAASTAAAAGTTTNQIPRYVGLEGPQLQTQLITDLANYLRLPASDINVAIPLINLGADSLTLSQIAGVFQGQYGFHIKDEHMFADGLTVNWLVENAAALRTAESAPVPPHTGTQQQQASAVPETTTVTDEGAVRAVPTVTPGIPRPEQASWFQRNCPCCFFCF